VALFPPGRAITRDDRRTPAQWYCLLAGLSLLLAGIFGFISDASFDTGVGVQGDPFPRLRGQRHS
jgi:hypothetical protein